MLFSTYSTATSGVPVLYVGKLAMLDSFGDWLVYDRDQTATL
jgi:hypothetical protein